MNAETNLCISTHAATDDGATLRQDVGCILLECHRDRLGDGVFRADVTHIDLHNLATIVARRLAPLIGGRYVPKRDHRAMRDAAVWTAFTGRNRDDVMRKFKISRELFYSIMSRKPRGI